MRECPACRRCFPDHVNHCPNDGDATTHSIAGEPILDGRYQLEKRLGHGGMGVVFKARHIFLKTAHAIKVILPDLVGNDPMLVTRFRQEALAAAAIRHPNIIAVTDFGVARGTMPFLVMEFVQGKSLHDILVAEKAIPPTRALELMTSIGAGVAAAHRQNIVHRDLKPLNIMLAEGVPVTEGLKILDFGLAKIKSGELLGSFVQAKTSGLMGSPFYMAPEQWGDEEPDARADIYSLGVILFQMLVGEVPFKGTSIPSIMKKHLTTSPPTMHDMGVFVPPQIEAAVRHALEKEALNRPGSVEAFLDELREAIEAAARAMKSTQIDHVAVDTATVTTPARDTSPPFDITVDSGQFGNVSHTDALIDSYVKEQSEASLEARRLRDQAAALDERARQAAEAHKREQERKERDRREQERHEQEERDRIAREELAREEEARLRAQAEARRIAEEEARLAAEAEARRVAEEEARRAAEVEARRKVEEEARLRAEEEARRKAAEEAQRKAEEEARLKAKEEARRKAEEEARLKAEEEAARKRQAEEAEARRRAELEAERERVEAEARRREEEEAARAKAEEDARLREAEEETRRRDELAARKRFEEETQRAADALKQWEQEQRERRQTERLRLEEVERANAEAAAAAERQRAANQQTIASSGPLGGDIDLDSTQGQRQGIVTQSFDDSLPGSQTQATPWQPRPEPSFSGAAPGFQPLDQKRSNLPLIAAAVVAGILLIGGAATGLYYLLKPAAVTSPPVVTGPEGPGRPNKPPQVNAELIPIPGGTFQMGRDGKVIQEGPPRTVTVAGFAMDKTEVTNAEYEQFVREMNRTPPKTWVDRKPVAGQEMWPVSSVSLEDANAFAAWRSKRDSVTYRLPTEEEWEYAARGGDQQYIYPWGNNWVSGRTATKDSGSTTVKPVGSYAAGANRWGIVDLIGNVWEWTSSKPSYYPGNTLVVDPAQKDWAVIRGGSIASDPRSAKPISSVYRDWVQPSTREAVLGFRLVRVGS